MTQFPTQSHYPDTELASAGHILVMPIAKLGSDKDVILCHLWFDSVGIRTLELLHGKPAFLPIHSPVTLNHDSRNQSGIIAGTFIIIFAYCLYAYYFKYTHCVDGKHAWFFLQVCVSTLALGIVLLVLLPQDWNALPGSIGALKKMS